MKTIAECVAQVDQVLHLLGPGATIRQACLNLANHAGNGSDGWRRRHMRWMAAQIQKEYNLRGQDETPKEREEAAA
jgi:hypothetical protein